MGGYILNQSLTQLSCITVCRYLEMCLRAHMKTVKFWSAMQTYVFTLHPVNQRRVWGSCQTQDLLQLINT